MPREPIMTRQRLVVAGEALIDRMTDRDGAVSEALGGSPFNLALALGRLGCHTSYRSPLSSDSYGRQLAARLRASGVTLAGATVDRPTSTAMVRLDAAGQAGYSFQRDGVADRALAPLSVLDDWPGDAGLFHVGSLALVPPDGDAWCELLDALRTRFVTTSVDANMRPMAASDPVSYSATVKAVCAQANLLKVSDEDLLALGLGGEPLGAARSLLGQATQLVLLTLGARGAWCLTRKLELFQPAPCVDLVDSVGAGDCFYAGFLASLDEQQALHTTASSAQLQQAMDLAASCAAFNLGHTGCQPPSRHELAQV
jgi:fructokinase